MAPGVLQATSTGPCHLFPVSGTPQRRFHPCSSSLLWFPGQAELPMQLPEGEPDFSNTCLGLWAEYVPAFLVLISPISLPSPFLLFKALSVINLFGGLMPG